MTCPSEHCLSLSGRQFITKDQHIAHLNTIFIVRLAVIPEVVLAYLIHAKPTLLIERDVTDFGLSRLPAICYTASRKIFLHVCYTGGSNRPFLIRSSPQQTADEEAGADPALPLSLIHI